MRKKLTPRILTLTSSASTSANADCSGTTTTAKTIVLRSDFQNVASWKRRMKLSMPMNSRRPRRDQPGVGERQGEGQADRDEQERDQQDAGRAEQPGMRRALRRSARRGRWRRRAAVTVRGRSGAPARSRHGLVRRRAVRAGARRPEWPRADRSTVSSLEVVVGLLVGVDVLDGLVERLLRVRAVEDVLRGLGELGRDERVAGRRRAAARRTSWRSRGRSRSRRPARSP